MDKKKRNGFKCCLLLTSFLLLISCASRPVVDTKGIDIETYQQDLAECEEVSKQLESSKNIAKSAVFGAAVRGTIGAILDPDNAVKHATLGASKGTAVGALKNDQESGSIVKKCLINRGYKVLN